MCVFFQRMSLPQKKNIYVPYVLFQTQTRKRYGNLQQVKSIFGKGINEQKSNSRVGSKFKSFMTSVEYCILRYSFGHLMELCIRSLFHSDRLWINICTDTREYLQVSQVGKRSCHFSLSGHMATSRIFYQVGGGETHTSIVSKGEQSQNLLKLVFKSFSFKDQPTVVDLHYET
jgi:hypothetical protein